MYRMTVQEIAAKITKSAPPRTPVLIAVEGFGGSGKSTFAANLKTVLGDAFVISIDCFYLKDKISDATKSNFDRARLERQVLMPLKNGSPAAYRRLDWDTNRLSEPIKVPEVRYVIIEGVSSTDPDIASYYDFKIWIETPMNVAKARGSLRDRDLGADHDNLWDQWTSTYLEYKNLQHPEKRADFIYDNSENLLN